MNTASQLFNPDFIAKSMRRVSVETLKVEKGEIQSHWYHSEADSDLFFWMDKKGNIVKQQMTLMGQVVEWNIIEGLRTGAVIEDEVDSSGKTPPSQSVHFDESPQRSAVEISLFVIRNMDVLDAELQNILVECFENPRVLDEMDLNEAIKIYGSVVPKKSIWHTFLKKIKNIFRIS